MKYLHSGYILFCRQAEHNADGALDALGLFDVFVEKELPAKVDCCWVIGFGTPFERRQYKGIITIDDPDGQEVFTREFSANDPADIFKGHYIFRPEITLTKEGMFTAKVVLKNYKDDSVWDLQRNFWTMLESAAPPDP
jgi:hypothetical protein